MRTVVSPVDYEDVCGDFVNLKMMICRLSLLEVLIGVGCACIYRGECMLVYVDDFDCIVLKKMRIYFS